MVIHTKRNLRLVYANIYCDFTRQVSIHSFSAVRPRRRYRNSPVLPPQNRKRTARKIKPARLFYSVFHWAYPTRLFYLQNRKRTAGKIKSARLFLSRLPLGVPHSSVLPTKSETDGRKIKPARLFLSRLPLAYTSRQFYLRKTGSGWPRN